MKKIILIILLIIIAALAVVIITKPKYIPLVNRFTDTQEERVASLNGTLVSPEIAKKRPIAVMIENSTESRPQSGLIDADLVYEALAEGGITRFLAVFQTNSPDYIGPIRSAREYYAEIANELGAIYAHVGGSDVVLQNLASKKYKNLTDLNQFYAGDYFDRINNRSAPHNVYSSIYKVETWAEVNKVNQTANYKNWSFKAESKTDKQSTRQEININFSTSNYAVKYEYYPPTNSYLRFNGGKSHTDEKTGKQISAKNIIVQFVKTSSIPEDPKLRININLNGIGNALIFMDNHVIEGAKWEKQKDGRTVYYNFEGHEIAFNPGQTWIELVPDYNKNEVTWK